MHTRTHTPEIRKYLTGRRSFAAPVQIRELEHRSGSNELVIGGLAAVYESRSELLFGCFYEEIAKGAFRKALSRTPDVVCVFDHEGMPLARTSSGTLTLRDTPAGLEYEARMSGDVQQARDLYAAIDRGDVFQSSFSFCIGSQGTDQWSYESVEGHDLRRILDIGELYDVSPVSRPAYAAATVGARNVTTEPDPSTIGAHVDDVETQRGSEGDCQQFPTDGLSNDQTDHASAAEARTRALEMLRLGVSNVTDRTTERGS